MLPPTRFLVCLITFLTGCVPTGRMETPAEGEDTLAPSTYVVLAQKALTYQADFQWREWADLLAPDVEYYLPEARGPSRLVGKEAVLAYWKNWPQACKARQVSLSDFTILPLQTTRSLPLAKLPGVYVSVVFERTVIYESGQEVRRPGCLWLHFNHDKLIDRLYGFEV